MAKKYNKQIEAVCGALRHEGVMPSEIERRLHNDEAGIGRPVLIKERQIYNYIKNYCAENGPPPDGTEEDQTPDSIAKLRSRARALIAREVRYFEGKRPGKLTCTDSVLLRQHHTTLTAMEKDEEAAQQRGKARSKRPPSPSNPGEQGADETAIERLAREQRELEGEDGAAG